MKKKCLSLIIVVLLATMIAKKARSHRDSEWGGLTESEARSKLDAKLPSHIPDDKRDMISDKIVAKMRSRGVISDDPIDLTDSADDSG